LLRNSADFRQCETRNAFGIRVRRDRPHRTEVRSRRRRAGPPVLALWEKISRETVLPRQECERVQFPAPTWLAMHIRVKSDDSPSEMSIIAVASRLVANHCPNSILASGRRCLLRSGLPDPPPTFRSCLAIFSPSSASPSLPLTKSDSLGLAPFRRTLFHFSPRRVH